MLPALQAPHRKLFQLFSPPSSCWVTQEASAPLPAGFSFQVSAKSIASAGATQLSRSAGCFCSRQKLRIFPPRKIQGDFGHLGGILAILGGILATQGGGISAHPRVALPEELEASRSSIPIPAGGDRETHATINGAKMHHRPQRVLGHVSPTPQPTGRQPGVFLVGCKHQGGKSLPGDPSLCSAGSREPGA